MDRVVNSHLPNDSVPVKYRDNGDGTFSEQVYVANMGSGSGSGSGVSVIPGVDDANGALCLQVVNATATPATVTYLTQSGDAYTLVGAFQPDADRDTALTEAQLTAAGLAQDASIQEIITSLGADGDTPPTAGTGVRGWLRGIYDRLASVLTVNVDNEVAVTNDSTGTLRVTVDGGTLTADRELVTIYYTVITAFTGASYGDVITSTQIVDVSGAAPVTVGTAWYNHTTGVDVVVPTPFADYLRLEYSSQTALEDLRLTCDITSTILAQANTPLPGAGRLSTRSVMYPSTPRVLATSASVSSVTLSVDVGCLSMYATEAAWYTIDGSTPTSSSHYIAKSERLDIAVQGGVTLKAIRETADGSLRLTELR